MSDDPIQNGREGWVMKPKRCVTVPKGDGKSLKKMSGGRGRVPRASSLRYSLAEGVDGVDGIFGKPSQCHSVRIRRRVTVVPSCLSICPSVLLSFCPSVDLSFCRSVLLSICPSVDLSVCRSVLQSICPSVDLST